MRISSYVVAAGLLVSIAAPLRAQSLAEVAKKLEEQRSEANGTAKVYRNKDLKVVPADPSPTPPPADAAKPADTATDRPAEPDRAAPEAAAASRSETSDQAYWSKRMQDAREEVERSRILSEALQTRVNALNTDVIRRDDPAQRARLSVDRDRALEELDRQKKAVAAAESAIAALEEEARRAGVPPGWLR